MDTVNCLHYTERKRAFVLRKQCILGDFPKNVKVLGVSFECCQGCVNQLYLHFNLAKLSHEGSQTIKILKYSELHRKQYAFCIPNIGFIKVKLCLDTNWY